MCYHAHYIYCGITGASNERGVNPLRHSPFSKAF